MEKKTGLERALIKVEGRLAAYSEKAHKAIREHAWSMAACYEAALFGLHTAEMILKDEIEQETLNAKEN